MTSIQIEDPGRMPFVNSMEQQPTVESPAGSIVVFSNSYARLPERFFARLAPTPAPKPGLIKFNDSLASELGVRAQGLEADDLAAVFAGNVVPPGAEPIAMAYAGHQFGGFVPQLGDGRAILLGEVLDGSGKRRDIQLKGSGRTPFSRRGDGRAALGPVLREYLVSEAMHALGIPTTRALAAISTGESVYRERPLPGAVLTRVASSHIRVGTFQYFAARGDLEAVERLSDYVIDRHFPEARDAERPCFGAYSGGRGTPGPLSRTMDACRFHPWRDEHRQYRDFGRNDRFWSVRFHGCVRSCDRLQRDR
jgi:uncharacterized protein YdiU (UPF0061 family)